MHEIQLEQMITVRKNGELVGIVGHDQKKRTQVFSSCSSMGAKEIQDLLVDLTANNGLHPTADK